MLPNPFRTTRKEFDTTETPQAQQSKAQRNAIKKRRAKNKIAKQSRKVNRR